MPYSDIQLRKIIADVVREAKATAHVDTGYLRRSIKGDIIGKDKSLEFRQIFYGAYNNNSQLPQIAAKLIPKDIKWKVKFLDENGKEEEVYGTTKTGRKVQRKQVTSESIGTAKIKALIASIKANGKKKDDRAEGNRE